MKFLKYCSKLFGTLRSNCWWDGIKGGIIFGMLLVFGLSNVKIGLPLILGYLILTGNYSKPVLSNKDIWIFSLIIIKIVWLATVHFFYKSASPDSLFYFARLISMDLIFLIVLCIRREEKFFYGLAIPIFGLFFIDAIFNITTLVHHAHLLGRISRVPPEDYLPMLGGFFSHPFYSINISVIAMLFAFYLKKKWLVALTMLNVLVNGSQRGVLTIIVFWFVYFLIRQRARFIFLLLASITAAAGVFVACYCYTIIFPGWGANYVRILAWQNALATIPQSCFIGYAHTVGYSHIFRYKEIVTPANAESAYLQYALDYGMPAALLHFAILYSIFQRNIREFIRPMLIGSEQFKFIAAIFACLAFIDTFYGTLIGSVLTSVCFGLFVLTGQHLIAPMPKAKHSVQGKSDE